MKSFARVFLIPIAVWTALVALPNWAVAAPPPVVFSKQIMPLFRAQCVGCHGGAAPVSGYAMESRDKLLAGGRHGAAIVVGKGKDSNLVRYLTGDLQPKMPPSGSLDLEKIALIRRWIDEGAKVDSMTADTGKREEGKGNSGQSANSSLIIHHSSLPAPVTALAYSPDGKTLAVGGYRCVRLVDPATGTITRTVGGPSDQVQCVSWSRDGRFLAASGGIPGASGEVVIFDAQSWKPVRTLAGHTEVVYSVAWKPNAPELATGSLDKTARVWNANTGECVRTIKDHAEGVFSVAYSPDGKLLATASGDRTAKIFDTGSWKRLATLNAHSDGLTHCAFSFDGKLLATAALDHTVRIWPIESGKVDKIENPLRTQYEGDTINTCAFSPDSKLFVWGSVNRVVKVFNGDATQQTRDWHDLSDWIYTVAVAADNVTIAAGTQDGKLLFWNAGDGKLLRTVNIK